MTAQEKNPIIIPPRPAVLLDIQRIMREEEPEIEAIANLVKEDLSLYTILLSAVNSPWMGLAQPATSVEQAIMLMGLDRVFSLIQGVCIRNSLEGVKLDESFWSAAVDVAGICSNLATRYTGIERNTAYSAGMLHNVGIAIMCKHHEGFSDFIKVHDHLDADELCVRERNEFDTDHYLQGAMMAKNWHLGEDVPLAIRYQPLAGKILSGQKKMKETVATMLAILTLAKTVSFEFRRYWLIEDDCEHTVSASEMALNYLHINHTEFEELKDEMLDDFLDKSA